MNTNEMIGTGNAVISGTFECRDKDGVLLKTIDMTCSIPLADLLNPTTTEEDHGTELGK